MAGEPLSWLAIEEIERRLNLVTGPGYYTDLTSGIITTDPKTERKDSQQTLTLISATAFAEKPEASGRRTKSSDMEVMVEVTIPFEIEHNPALIAHRARADVIKALSGGAFKSDAGIRSIEITGSGIVIGIDGGGPVVIAQVTARAGLTESTTPAT